MRSYLIKGVLEITAIREAGAGMDVTAQRWTCDNVLGRRPSGTTDIASAVMRPIQDKANPNRIGGE
jgi:hypothetical protein